MGLPIEAEVLHLLELPNPFAGALTANPGLLYSPKGGGGIGNQAAVYPNHSDFDSFREMQRPVQVAVNVRGQSHLGAIYHFEEFILVCIFLNGGERAEDFVL